MIQHHLPDAWSAETASALYPVPSCRSASGLVHAAWTVPALRAADWRDCLPPAATPAHGSQPGSGSSDGSAPMRHADDDHAGHPMPQPAR